MKFPEIPGFSEDASISYEVIDVELPNVLTGEGGDRVSSFLTAVAKTHRHDITSLAYVFCSDAELLQMNLEYLDHDTYTDIITFDLSDESDVPLLAEDTPGGVGSSHAGELEAHAPSLTPPQAHPTLQGECYISVDRVRENAARFGESLDLELLRVMVHGVLHLCGLGDKSKEQILRMRAAEADALAEWSNS